MTIQIKGMARTLEQLDRLDSIVRRSLEPMGEACAKVLYDAIREGMMEEKTGIHWFNLPYRSSAPGEMPAIQSGALFASLRMGADRPQPTKAFGWVGAGDGIQEEYPLYLERYYDAARRPYMRPALDENQPALLAAAADALDTQMLRLLTKGPMRMGGRMF